MVHLNKFLTIFLIALSILFFIIAIILFSDVSFCFAGIGISIIGFVILNKINH